MIGSEAIKEKLKQTFGYHQFRGEQEAIIQNTLSGNNSFVLMPTGAGKSLCYQLPAIMMEGTAIIISPLIALMKNQVDQLINFGINAQFLNSSLSKSEIIRVKDDVIKGKIKLLYIAPESLIKQDNLDFLRSAKISFFAIDEAHCISEWGHDFRPEYRKIKGIVENINCKLPILALTATATPKVQSDIQKSLGMEGAKIFKTSFNRKNLYYEIRSKKDIDRQLIRFIRTKHEKAGIIYCLSRKKVEEIAELLKINNINALPYHAGLDPAVRIHNQDAFLKDEVNIIVATIAFGMGIDKPDVRFVVHYDVPKSLEGYYQETGRAGRDGLEGTCIMFYSYEDIQKLDKFNKDKTPNEKESNRLLLEEMVNYTNLGLCRRKQILNYFGEYFNDNCGYCDNCMNPKESFKLEKEVVMVLEAIQAVGSNFDITHIAHILEGNKTQYVNSHNHHKIPQFGKGKNPSWLDEEDDDENQVKENKSAEKTVSPWASIIKQMMVYGLLVKNPDKTGCIKISEKGIDYLKKSTPLKFYEDHDYENEDLKEEEPEVFPGSDKAYDEGLFELLSNLRKKIAKEKNLPPYVIFQDPSLEEMATTYPSTNEEMAQINGVGMGKVIKFGKPFIEAIKRYMDENDIETAKEIVVKSTANKSKLKIYIIQQVDRKIDLDLIAEQKELGMDELINEIEAICDSGTKLNLDYYINQVIEPDKQDEIYDYFMSASTDNIKTALLDCDIDDVSEEELRLMRIKFMSELAN